MIMKLIKITFFTLMIFTNLLANNNFFNEGLAFYEKNKLDKAKFKFEQEIVYNPKSEKSYLYLSKIYKTQKKIELEKKNLNTVILLNPLNEEAVYNLAVLKLKESDFNESKKLINKLVTFCKQYCEKSSELKLEIEKSLKK